MYSASACPSLNGAIMRGLKGNGECYNYNREKYVYLLNSKNVKDIFLINRWSVYLYGYNENKGSESPLALFDEKTKIDDFDKRAADYANAIVQTSCSLVKAGKRVYIVKSVPEMIKNVPSTIAKAKLIFGKDEKVSISNSDYKKRNEIIFQAFAKAKKQCGVDIVDISKYLCDKESCYSEAKGLLLYSDDDHLNIYGNDEVKPAFVKVLKKL